MAEEIRVTASITASKNGAQVSASASKVIDMAGDQMISNVQIVGTSAEALSVGDVSTIGYVFVKNMDSTNFIELALDSAVSTQKFAKIPAGQFALFPASTATIYAKADTANCNVIAVALEL